MTEDREPESMSELLVAAAAWLDLADRAFAALATLSGRTYPAEQDTLQGSLRDLAGWFDANPDEARAAWAAVGENRDWSLVTEVLG